MFDELFFFKYNLYNIYCCVFVFLQQLFTTFIQNTNLLNSAIPTSVPQLPTGCAQQNVKYFANSLSLVLSLSEQSAIFERHLDRRAFT